MLTDWIGTQPFFNVTLPAGAACRNSPASRPCSMSRNTPEFTLRNTTDRWIVQSNIVNVTPL